MQAVLKMRYVVGIMTIFYDRKIINGDLRFVSDKSHGGISYKQYAYHSGEVPDGDYVAWG